MGFREVTVRISCDILIPLSLDVVDGRIRYERYRRAEKRGGNRDASAFGSEYLLHVGRVGVTLNLFFDEGEMQDVCALFGAIGNGATLLCRGRTAVSIT